MIVFTIISAHYMLYALSIELNLISNQIIVMSTVAYDSFAKRKKNIDVTRQHSASYHS